MAGSDRLNREKSFHDKRFGGDGCERKAARKYYSVNKHLHKRYTEIVSSFCKGKNLLEYGCGTGSNSIQWIQLGAKVTGIDISTEAIKKAKEEIAGSEYHAEYFVMNAENTEFDNDSFDVVVGTGVIHHLDLKNAYQELSRICRPTGHMVFCEPLGHNPFINIYRWLTPNMRTEDEHPLKQPDIKMLKKYFHNVQIEYFTLLTLLAVPFRNMPFFHWLCDFLRSIDKMLFYFPFIKKYAWSVILHAYSPRESFDGE